MSNTKILIVEDEIIIAKDIQSILKTLGYDASVIVSYGEEAIKKTEEIKPDLVLMNIDIKGDMDGIEAAAEIHNLFNIPVVFLTGYMDEERLKRAKTTEPFSYVIKPFNERELHSTIVRALK